MTNKPVLPRERARRDLEDAVAYLESDAGEEVAVIFRLEVIGHERSRSGSQFLLIFGEGGLDLLGHIERRLSRAIPTTAEPGGPLSAQRRMDPARTRDAPDSAAHPACRDHA